jgi:hypothetical protein
MNPEDYLKNARAYFWDETFAIIRSEHIYPEAFANITDKDEITVIIDQSKLENTGPAEIDNRDLSRINKKNISGNEKHNHSESEKNWKILTLDIVFPLDIVGILAKISGVLAERGISVLTISAYSRDHFLIREKDMQEAIAALKSLGISVH